MKKLFFCSKNRYDKENYNPKSELYKPGQGFSNFLRQSCHDFNIKKSETYREKTPENIIVKKINVFSDEKSEKSNLFLKKNENSLKIIENNISFEENLDKILDFTSNSEFSIKQNTINNISCIDEIESKKQEESLIEKLINKIDKKKEINTKNIKNLNEKIEKNDRNSYERNCLYDQIKFIEENMNFDIKKFIFEVYKLAQTKNKVQLKEKNEIANNYLYFEDDQKKFEKSVKIHKNRKNEIRDYLKNLTEKTVFSYLKEIDIDEGFTLFKKKSNILFEEKNQFNLDLKKACSLKTENEPFLTLKSTKSTKNVTSISFNDFIKMKNSNIIDK